MNSHYPEEYEPIELCGYRHVHEDLVKQVLSAMPEEDDLYSLADFFKVFADSTRIRILYVLLCSETCVCDIAQLLNMTQPAISHQLRILKQMNLVRARREGKTVFYSLADDHIASILRIGMEHICEE
ncbi:MAG: winged helix-turn-helix transcriptional regulator [Lachnospiraceae bacterium]|nr:winged helix-turn-helix transcriptional regulator [Lachnospiraceae bacterium]MBQ6196808.1 winged helix-turn-helix transcriptional regulator [Lachnospiraceae bacterium]